MPAITGISSTVNGADTLNIRCAAATTGELTACGATTTRISDRGLKGQLSIQKEGSTSLRSDGHGADGLLTADSGRKFGGVIDPEEIDRRIMERCRHPSLSRSRLCFPIQGSGVDLRIRIPDAMMIHSCREPPATPAADALGELPDQG